MGTVAAVGDIVEDMLGDMVGELVKLGGARVPDVVGLIVAVALGDMVGDAVRNPVGDDVSFIMEAGMGGTINSVTGKGKEAKEKKQK